MKRTATTPSSSRSATSSRARSTSRWRATSRRPGRPEAAPRRDRASTRARPSRWARSSRSTSSRPAPRCTSPAPARARASPGVMKRHNFKGGPGRPRFALPPRAWLDRPVRHAVPRLQGPRAAGSHGRRDRHRPEARGRQGRRRAEPARSSRALSPAARTRLLMIRAKLAPESTRGDSREMATVEVKDMQRQEGGDGRARRRPSSASQPNTHAVHLVVRSQMAGAPRRYARHARRAARSPAAARSRGARRAPAARARVPPAPRSGPAAARSSDRTRAATVSRSRTRSSSSRCAASCRRRPPKATLYVVDAFAFDEPSTKAAAADAEGARHQGPRRPSSSPNGDDAAIKSLRNIEQGARDHGRRRPTPTTWSTTQRWSSPSRRSSGSRGCWPNDGRTQRHHPPDHLGEELRR